MLIKILFYLFSLNIAAFFIIETNTEITNERPNFIIYLSDDQDFLDYNVFGNENVQSVSVNKLAMEGIRFTNFHTASAICTPSRSQLYTGLYPVKNGSYTNHTHVKKETKTIVQHLSEIGYEVVLAGKSHVGPYSTFSWDSYIQNKTSKQLDLESIEKYLKNIKKPFCLILASDFPHGPYPEKTDYSYDDIKIHPYNNRVSPEKPGYYQNIKYDDNQLGEILRIVERNDLKNNTVFIYASDHGISGKFTLYQKGIKIPVIMRWPGKIKKNIQSNRLLGMVDILPTIMDIGGGKTNTFDGKSFSDLLIGNDKKVNDYVYGVSTRQNIRNGFIFPSRMISNGKYKMIKNFNSIEVYKKNLNKGRIINKFIEIGAKKMSNIPYIELYDLDSDPYEKINIANIKSSVDIINELSEKLEEWMLSQNDIVSVGNIPLIKPTQHPLDQPSKWMVVQKNLIGKIKESDYIKTHY
tara:strand:- start:739 stop:2136 length:1398 start_codon:yes stop_codon:yes gene_type:complete